MEINAEGTAWVINEEITSPIYVKTLKTAGTFLDKNISITLTPKKGSVELSSSGNTEQIITVVNDNTYAVQAKSTIVITPTITSGWIETIDSKEVVSESVIYFNKTRLKSELVEDTSQPSGSSVYRVSATSGYNETQLDKDINVFQGFFIIKGE